MTPEEAIRELDSLPGGPGSDPEGVHCLADGILLKLAGPEVTAAYDRVIDRQPWWASA